MFNGERIVVKVGSSLLVDDHGNMRTEWLSSLCQDISHINAQTVIVSSGAVAVGRSILGLSNPLSMPEKQACASVGQLFLCHSYQEHFCHCNKTVSQILLTLDDSTDCGRRENIQNTFNTLLSLGVVPIVNENDTVATEEIVFGDNDRLAATVANMIGAQKLILLSDVDGLFTDNPRINQDADFIPVVSNITTEIENLAGGAGSQYGTGGMATKISAAKMCNCDTIVTNGVLENPLTRIVSGGRYTVFQKKT